jgi:hypothetical protein
MTRMDAKTMRSFLTFVAIVLCTVKCNFSILAAEGESSKQVIKDKSPDGKFALELTHGEEGWDTAIIGAKTKKKIIDLENVAVSGDEVRTDWMRRGDYPSLEDYGKDATLLWSNDSQRVAYFNEDRDEHTASVYFRSSDTFEEVALPEIPRCDEIKGEDPKDLHTLWYKLTPESWLDSQTLLITLSGEWRTLNDKWIECEQNVTFTFDAQRHASVAKIEKPVESIGQKIESPNGSLFFEEIDVSTENKESERQIDKEVWIASADDPVKRERLPDLDEYEESPRALNEVSISPDANWILVGVHHGSHMKETFLFHRKEGLKFEDVFPDASFDKEAWKFFCKAEKVPLNRIDASSDFPEQAEFLDWSDDSARLLICLHGGLTGQGTSYGLADYKKAGVSGWVTYYNTKTHKFELTDRLRKNNKGARKRWREIGNEEGEESGFVPSSAESIGHEGPEVPVAGRLRKYEAELTVLVKHHESQLEGVDHAEFQKKERDWREEFEAEATKIKDPQKRLGFRTRSTWYHLDNVRQEWLPVYGEPKSAAGK